MTIVYLVSVQGRGWIPYQPTTCWKHLSDCPSQTEEVRQKAREELGRHNARRRGKTQHTSTWRAHRRMVPDVSQALQSLADLGIRTSTMSSGSANHLSCVPDVSALSLSPPSPTPTVTQVEVSPLGAVSYNSLCLDACLALEVSRVILHIGYLDTHETWGVRLPPAVLAGRDAPPVCTPASVFHGMPQWQAAIISGEQHLSVRSACSGKGQRAAPCHPGAPSQSERVLHYHRRQLTLMRLRRVHSIP